ncbi:MAG: hypothetical protein H7A51_00920 [Akkermansiaceae bacterium]|nr:hypothetical protein [Akkermansiaceae bacterium]
MSTVKSYSVGNGDTFYIEHNSDNFTIIDCNLRSADENIDRILDELAALSGKKGITRFISTHPDDDHIHGLESLDERIGILNFYCVANEATKPFQDEHFDFYKSLRDSTKAFNIYKGCSRRWMNAEDDERKSAGINIKWPKVDNECHKKALQTAKEGKGYNNMSAIVRYSINNGPSYLWMGDLENAFMKNIEDEVDWVQTTILFAPHHGRKSGKVPQSILEKIAPKIVIVGEAESSGYLDYYDGYNTITQLSKGDIVFENDGDYVHIYTSKDSTVKFLEDKNRKRNGYYYLGSQKV